MFTSIFTPLVTQKIDTFVMQKMVLRGVADESFELIIDVQNKVIPTIFNVEENQTDENKYFWMHYDTYHTPHKFILKSEFIGQYINTEFLLRGALLGSGIIVTSSILLEHTPKLNPKQVYYKLDFTLLNVLILLILYYSPKNSEKKSYKLIIISFLIFSVNFIKYAGVNLVLNQGIHLAVDEFEFPTQPSFYNMTSLNEYIPILTNHTAYNEERCHVCNFKPIPTASNSSPRDLIITCAINEVRNVDTFVRSCRTTGCRATIVIITNKDVSFFERTMEHCGVFFVRTDYDGTSYEALTGARFKVVTTLLNLLPPGAFDRVLYADLYDTVFQGDPFLANVTADSVALSDEDHLIRDSTWSMQYYRGGRMFGFPEEETERMPTICSGLFVGGFEAVRLMFNAVGNWMPLDMMTAPIPDQLYFNVFIASHTLERAGFKVFRVRAGEWLTSASINYPEFTQSFPARRNGFDTVPVVMHHSNRIQSFFHETDKKCTQEKHIPSK